MCRTQFGSLPSKIQISVFLRLNLARFVTELDHVPQI